MLRFRLRTLLIAVALVAVGLGWVASSLNWIRQRQRIRETSCVLVYEFSHSNPRKGVLAPFPLRFLGEKGAANIDICGRPVSADEVRKWFPEATVSQFAEGKLAIYESSSRVTISKP
jgi:hypothetical protein